MIGKPAWTARWNAPFLNGRSDGVGDAERVPSAKMNSESCSGACENVVSREHTRCEGTEAHAVFLHLCGDLGKHLDGVLALGAVDKHSLGQRHPLSEDRRPLQLALGHDRRRLGEHGAEVCGSGGGSSRLVNFAPRASSNSGTRACTHRGCRPSSGGSRRARPAWPCRGSPVPRRGT